MQPVIISSALILLNFEISGKDTNDEQPLNIDFILEKLEEFHFEISGSDDNDEQPLNIDSISVTFEVYQNGILQMLMMSNL